MPDNSPSFLVGALSGLLTGLAALAAYYAATRQNRLTATAVAGDWLRDLRAWASEAVDVLAEAAYCCPKSLGLMSESEKAVVVRCRHCLSALVDRGRFLLPNEGESDRGERKSGAYKGFRPPALAALVAAERILGEDIDLFEFPNAKSALLGVRREFVSIVQTILDPRSMNKSVAAVLQHAQEDRKRDLTVGGLLPDPSKVPESAKELIYIASRRFTSHGAGVSK